MGSAMSKNPAREQCGARCAVHLWFLANVAKNDVGTDVILGDNYDGNAFVMKLLADNGIKVQATSKRDLAPYRDHPLVAALMTYRYTSKALSSTLAPIRLSVHPKTGRVRPHYGQIGSWSGRMSCGNPNIQQIPREAAFHACFCAPAGRALVLADYSQIELRVAAQISGDRRMTTAFRQGEDLHALTAPWSQGSCRNRLPSRTGRRQRR